MPYYSACPTLPLCRRVTVGQILVRVQAGAPIEYIGPLFYSVGWEEDKAVPVQRPDPENCVRIYGGGRHHLSIGMLRIESGAPLAGHFTSLHTEPDF